jgi:hypothetical protein
MWGYDQATQLGKYMRLHLIPVRNPSEHNTAMIVAVLSSMIICVMAFVVSAADLSSLTSSFLHSIINLLSFPCTNFISTPSSLSPGLWPASYARPDFEL